MSDNPFLTEPMLSFTQHVISSLIKTETLTVQVDREVSSVYASLTAASLLPVAGDPLTSCYAFMYEVARAYHMVSSPEGIELEASDCGHEACQAIHKVEAAFCEAAGRGDFDAAVNVVKAVVRETQSQDQDPRQALCEMFSSLIVTLALNMAEAVRQS